MLFDNKEIKNIDESDLQSLIVDQVPEGKIIDYKEAIIGTADNDKKEFLADVSSFSNSSGGYLVLGVKESNGLPTEIIGLDISNIDSEINRLENIIRDGIEPRIPGITIHSIKLQTLKTIILIHIPRSWALPHMVTFKGTSRFFSRNSGGKYPLDVNEIRTLFTVSSTLVENIKNFRIERLSKIVSQETPLPLAKIGKIVLHLIPFTSFDPTIRFDLNVLRSNLPGPIGTTLPDYRFNFDGLLTYFVDNELHRSSYLQIFNNGIIEAAESYLLSYDNGIPAVVYEKELVTAVSKFLKAQKKLGVSAPIVIALSLVDVSGYHMTVDNSQRYSGKNHQIDRDSLMIPEIVLDDLDDDPTVFMKPIFDTIWNATGWEKSLNYDEHGKWNSGNWSGF